MRRRARFLACALAALLGVGCAGPLGRPQHAGLEHDAEHDWRAEPHHVSLFLGGTFEEEDGRDLEATTVGLDYEYRVSDFLGLGGVAEHAAGPIDATTFLAVADLHITNQFIMQTGPGIEFLNGKSESEFVYRVGFLYEWETDGYTLSPQLHYDMRAGEDALIFGFAFGVAF